MSPKNRKRIAFAAVAAIAAAGISVWISVPPAMTLRGILHSKGYIEIVPPSRLHGPGTINTVQVAGDGRVLLNPTCDIDPKVLSAAIQESESTDESFTQVVAKRFDISSQIKKLLSSALAQSRTESVQVSLEKVSVLAISDESLLNVQSKFITGGCERAILWNLKRGQKVCQTVAVLRADVTYTIRFKSGLTAAEQAKISGELAQKLKLEAERQGTDRIVGRGLFYGVRLHPNEIIVNAPGVNVSNCQFGHERT